MNRQAQAVVLLLFGGAVLRASLTDQYLRYVKEGLRPFLIAAGVVLVATAAMTLWHDLRPGPPTDDDGHGHAHPGPRVGWLLLLPVLGLVLVAPPALGSYTAGQAGTITVTASDSVYPALPPGDPAPLGLVDYASRALFDGGRSLAGRRLQLTGFVTPGPDGTAMLARIVLTCCAADGRPIKVGLTGPARVDAPADTWVRVTGVYSDTVGKDAVNRVDVAYVEVQDWTPVEAPKRQYE